MLSDKWINGIPLADKKLLSMRLTIPPAFPSPLFNPDRACQVFDFFLD